ncbi:hypothetical protein L211DRAFT_624154 [Terfezia boudieri ATCC MYA-4762]|uniref:Uncharacterized protein n=1 Tax=Terfezia boudieri ATCC MYA-4762 TaxID=1051890 RepID=A0A3N4L9M5_9PEZI|nr:hypothetical protein L211DRAFT_624154 [Terfezia boudieri ATCC MYA-4762]
MMLYRLSHTTSYLYILVFLFLLIFFFITGGQNRSIQGSFHHGMRSVNVTRTTDMQVKTSRLLNQQNKRFYGHGETRTHNFHVFSMMLYRLSHTTSYLYL